MLSLSLYLGGIMKTIKLIDLLNMLVNNKYENMPRFIKYGDVEYEYYGLSYFTKGGEECLDRHICLEDLEYPVEILDEDEFEDIENIRVLKDATDNDELLAITINKLMNNQKKIIERLKDE